ncbi:MAG: VIT1/CCC1 transporter family protein [Candidatus Izimaplasma sp.]|nr:VIT1/CCC1 transporter family protein [Candidatus Izimaplasma bacterium]
MDQTIKKQVLKMQKDEITSSILYGRLSKRSKSENTKKLLKEISKDEKRHYEFFKALTEEQVKPNKLEISILVFLSIIFGITFTSKILEKREEDAQEIYKKLEKDITGIKEIIEDEERHEEELINDFNEERLSYVSSVVLGLNDALVELTGALAGLTFALADPKTVALAGLITGVAAAFSMASSEYLATKQDESHKEALISSVYTGTAYIIAVMFLVFPYLLGLNVYVALGMMIGIVILIIFLFNFYISVAKNLNFKKRFFEMVTISLGVAFVSFIFSFIIKASLGA